MARTSVTTQEIVLTGLEPVLTAPIADGDVIDCGPVALWVDNASVVDVDVTVQTTATVDGLNLEDLVVTVTAGEARLIGPFPARSFGQLSGDDKDRAYVDYETVADVTRAVVSF